MYDVGNNVIFNRRSLSILHGVRNTVQIDNCNPDPRTGELAKVGELDFGNDENATIDAPIKLTDSNFRQALDRHPLLIVDFFAPWCGPCRILAPIIEQVASEMTGKAVFGKLNVDENPEIASLFEIQSVPTVIMFKNGKLVDGFRGVAPKAEINSMITTMMSLRISIGDKASKRDHPPYCY